MITIDIIDTAEFYWIEEYHQQYPTKNLMVIEAS